MSTHDDKVKRLLDGEIDEAEIAADPILASLAERIFGLNIEPITPTKPSQEIAGPEVEVVAEVTNADSMVEVIPEVTTWFQILLLCQNCQQYLGQKKMQNPETD